MEGSVSLSRAERMRVKELFDDHPNPDVRRRCHMISLLDDGRSWSQIVAFLYCSTRTIDHWKNRFEQGGVDA